MKFGKMTPQQAQKRAVRSRKQRKQCIDTLVSKSLLMSALDTVELTPKQLTTIKAKAVENIINMKSQDGIVKSIAGG